MCWHNGRNCTSDYLILNYIIKYISKTTHTKHVGSIVSIAFDYGFITLFCPVIHFEGQNSLGSHWESGVTAGQIRFSCTTQWMTDGTLKRDVLFINACPINK